MHVLFKNVIRKMNKYIEDKNERKYKKINILKIKNFKDNILLK